MAEGQARKTLLNRRRAWKKSDGGEEKGVMARKSCGHTGRGKKRDSFGRSLSQAYYAGEIAEKRIVRPLVLNRATSAITQAHVHKEDVSRLKTGIVGKKKKTLLASLPGDSV